MKSSPKGRKTNFRELRPSNRKLIKFNAGNVIRELPIEYEKESELVVIKFEDIKSPITRNNLLMLNDIYHIKWNKVTRYPIYERFGYIIEGLMNEEHKVTYVRKEVRSKGAGTTDLWFDNGYMLPATKILRACLQFNEIIEYWGKNIKKEAIDKWVDLTRHRQILMSYKLSKIVHGNKNKREQPHKYPEEVIEWIVSIARKLDDDDFLRLVGEIQKVQFERV